jgi:hypothetical protein
MIRVVETGWMIEKKDAPIWWAGFPARHGAMSWTIDPNIGIRFARKVDAELCAIAQGYSLSSVKATEHEW